jgi:hypothetical protein
MLGEHRKSLGRTQAEAVDPKRPLKLRFLIVSTVIRLPDRDANRISEGPPASGLPFLFHTTILRRKL